MEPGDTFEVERDGVEYEVQVIRVNGVTPELLFEETNIENKWCEVEALSKNRIRVEPDSDAVWAEYELYLKDTPWRIAHVGSNSTIVFEREE